MKAGLNRARKAARKELEFQEAFQKRMKAVLTVMQGKKLDKKATECILQCSIDIVDDLLHKDD